MSKTHLGHTARKRFGQNFLHDDYVIGNIVSAINPVDGENLRDFFVRTKEIWMKEAAEQLGESAGGGGKKLRKLAFELASKAHGKV